MYIKTMKTKVLYNTRNCWVSFSTPAVNELQKLGVELGAYGEYYGSRHDPVVVALVESLGLKESSGDHTSLAIREIESDRYRIDRRNSTEVIKTPADIGWTEECKSHTILVGSGSMATAKQGTSKVSIQDITGNVRVDHVLNESVRQMEETYALLEKLEEALVSQLDEVRERMSKLDAAIAVGPARGEVV
jgi:prefoldin subunit 5